MKFPGPDQAVYAWHSAQLAASSARGPSFGQTGRDYARQCFNARCRRMGTRVTTYKKGLPTVKCRVCGTPWQSEEALIPSSVFGSGNRVRPPLRVELAATLDLVIQALYNATTLEAGSARVYVSWLCKGGTSFDKLARDADAQEYAGRNWARKDVRRAVDSARRWLEIELARRGLLQETE